MLLFLLLLKSHVDVASVDHLVALAIDKARPERGPGGHQELLLLTLNIDDAILILH